MPLNYTAYSLVSPEAIVRECLGLKRYHVQNTWGIGPLSCCACIEYFVQGRIIRTFGNSRLQNPIEEGIYTHPYMRCHGEASAVMQALENCQAELQLNGGDIAGLIYRIYIELSPCDRCQPLLNNINPNLNILYSWRYPDQLPDWRAAARVLCS
jgi:hypothetical protein